MAEVVAHHHNQQQQQPSADAPASSEPHLQIPSRSQSQLQSQQEPATTNTATTVPHGTKRAHDNTFEPEQRLSKRFDLLNLEANGARLYIPIPGAIDSTPHPTPPNNDVAPISLSSSSSKKNPRARRTPSSRSRASAYTKSQQDAASTNSSSSSNGGDLAVAAGTPRAAEDEFMQIDPTPHKLYIHDLNAELSDDLSSDDETPIFLSDIERHLSKIPRHVLLAGTATSDLHRDPHPAVPEPTPDNQVVLYNVPSSLSVPQERDSVRMAIVEARARVRERQAGGAGAGAGAEISPAPAPAMASTNDAANAEMIPNAIADADADADADAMDID
ncbi:unnamed protein product [Periconia digitata]|uniref:Uncharacterized protein n=1 Tax=Periconia digitata TaxID=1303443 RepID=A0A9W4U8N0_9PLEO|nr:unnamed protein product [Periconia digitata]